MHAHKGMRPLPLIVLIAVLAGLGGCSRNSGPDPADANMAPVDQSGYAAQPTEPVQQPAGGVLLTEAPSPPPPLPVYNQPPCPGQDYMWTPGNWAYGEYGYYWVPGAWVLAPYVGALWTPPYWDHYGGHYRWHHGYWGPHVGFYGGVNYSFGYTGMGFYGGYWNDRVFVYNRAVTNADPRIVRNVYSRSVTNYTPLNRVSFNGPGGIVRQPAPQELASRHENRIAPLPAQVEHMRQSAFDRGQLAGANRGRPPVAALPAPLAAPYRAPEAPPRGWQRDAERQAASPPVSQSRPEMPRPGGMRGEAPRMVPEQAPPTQRPEVEQRPSPFEGRRGPMPPHQRMPEASPSSPADAGRRQEGRPALPPQPAPQMAQQAPPSPAVGGVHPRHEETPPAPPPQPAPQMAPHAAPAGRGAPPHEEAHPAPQQPGRPEGHPGRGGEERKKGGEEPLK